MATPKKTSQINLESIRIPPDISDTPDEKTKQEVKELYQQERLANLAKLNQDLTLRGKYSDKLFCLIRNWLIAIFFLLLTQGILGKLGYFNLSDKVLITIIGGTTLNVLGLFAIVANYIFPKQSANTKLSKKNHH